MMKCTHVPRRPFYSQNTSGCQNFLILDGLVSQSDVVVVVDDGDAVVVVQRACGYMLILKQSLQKTRFTMKRIL